MYRARRASPPMGLRVGSRRGRPIMKTKIIQTAVVALAIVVGAVAASTVNPVGAYVNETGQIEHVDPVRTFTFTITQQTVLPVETNLIFATPYMSAAEANCVVGVVGNITMAATSQGYLSIRSSGLSPNPGSTSVLNLQGSGDIDNNMVTVPVVGFENHPTNGTKRARLMYYSTARGTIYWDLFGLVKKC